jgi:2-(1,2-epoxy-1,2-dihydrophenyl)acetyl-CoA isomerase
MRSRDGSCGQNAEMTRSLQHGKLGNLSETEGIVSDVLLIDRAEGVVTLTMNRPESRNALNPALIGCLLEAVTEVVQDPSVRAIVLTGAGESFCAGGDLKQSAHRPDASSTAGEPPGDKARLTTEERIARLRTQMEISRLIHRTSKPTIAMIRGPAVGAGLSLAAACDLRIASDNAVFMTAFVPYGFGGDFGGSYFWTRILGTARARELYLLSEKLTARQALEMGVINRVVADAELEIVTKQLACELAKRLPSAIHYIKDNLNTAEHATLEQVLEKEATNMVLSVQAAAAAYKRGRAETEVPTP